MSELQDRIAERLAALDRSQLAGLDLDKREKFIKTAIGLLYACGWRAAEPKAVVTITDDCNRSDVADALIIRLDCPYFPTQMHWRGKISRCSTLACRKPVLNLTDIYTPIITRSRAILRVYALTADNKRDKSMRLSPSKRQLSGSGENKFSR